MDSKAFIAIVIGICFRAEAMTLYRIPLSNMFKSQEEEGSGSFYPYEVPQEKTKFIRKRVLGTNEEGSSLGYEEKDIRSMEAFDFDSFW